MTCSEKYCSFIVIRLLAKNEKTDKANTIDFNIVNSVHTKNETDQNSTYLLKLENPKYQALLRRKLKQKLSVVL